MTTPEHDYDQPANDRLEQRSRELFDDRVANLDARTRSRLNQARHAALEVARGSAANPMRWFLPIGSAAALTLVVLTSLQLTRSGIDAPVVEESAVTSAVDDLEILTSSDELGMLQEMEFYAWLEIQPEAS